MTETADNTYATTSGNLAAGAPNKVAVVNDGTGDRQVVVLGAGDGTQTIVDGTSSNPVNVTGVTLTNGTQKTQIVDGSGNVISSTSNALNVAMSATAPSITVDTDNADFKDDFPGTTLNSSNWTVTQKTGSATTYSVASSILTINAQTTANDYIAFTSVQTFTAPFRVQVIFKASQMIANNNFYIEVVNASGTSTTALATTAVTTGTTQAAYAITGTTATTSNIVAQNQGVKATADTAATIVTTASYVTFELDCRIDITDFATRMVDVTSNVTTNSTMRSRTVLDPGEQYYVQLRSLNGGTSPASNTAYTIEAVIVQDVSYTAVEIMGGRGNNSFDKSVPVVIGSTVTASPNTITAITGSITTSSTSIVSSSTSSVAGMGLVSIHGTYAGVSFGITVSDDGGTTYYPVPIYDATAMQWLAQGATITPGTNASKQYWVPTPPVSCIIKVLSSAFTSGTGSIRIMTGYEPTTPGSTMSQLMDAAGNARGANVDANNNLNVASQFAPVGTKFNSNSYHITTNTTNTPTASTAYIISVAISAEVGGTTSTVTIQDKSGTPLKLINGLATTAPTTAPTVLSFTSPVLMTGGIDVITSGAVAGTVDVWVSWFQ